MKREIIILIATICAVVFSFWQPDFDIIDNNNDNDHIEDKDDPDDNEIKIVWEMPKTMYLLQKGLGQAYLDSANRLNSNGIEITEQDAMDFMSDRFSQATSIAFEEINKQENKINEDGFNRKRLAELHEQIGRKFIDSLPNPATETSE